MKDHHQALNTLRDIEATSSRHEKQALLEKLAATDIGKFLLIQAYDPFITYGIKIAPPTGGGSGKVMFRPELMRPILMKLAKRELTGKAAEREISEIMAMMDYEGAELFYRVLSKDLKCGIAETTINSVIPDLIPTFCVMRAHPYEERKIKKWPVKGEPKLDGQRNTFMCVNGLGGFFTRSGKRVSALDFLVPVIVQAAQRILDHTHALDHILKDKLGGLSFVLDGEAMMGLFEETGALRRKDQDAVGAELHLYDIMSFTDFDAVGSVGDKLSVRREHLSLFVRLAKELLPAEHKDVLQIVPQYFLNGPEDVIDFFEQMRAKTLASYLARGDVLRETKLLETTIDKATGKPKVLEGIMVKDPDGLYDKKKSNGWLKLKPEETEDLPVVGFFPGEPGTKYANSLGGLVVLRKGVLVRVGGGFTDAERDSLWDLATDEVLRTDKALIQKEKDATIIRSAVFTEKKLIHRLIQVEFHEVTPDGSLRHPRFMCFRDDKDGEIEDKEAHVAALRAGQNAA